MEALIDSMMLADVETFRQVYREADRLQRLVNDLQELGHEVMRLLRQIAKEQQCSVVIVSPD